MSFGKAPSFTATLWVGVLTAGLTGCRLGNQIEHAPAPYSPSGYYQTEPKELSLTTKVEGIDTVLTDIEKIPPSYNNLMTNPVYLSFSELQESDTEAAKLGILGYVTIEDAPGKYQLANLLLTPSPYPPIYDYESTPEEGETLWADPNCKWFYERELQGSYSKFEEATRNAAGLLLKGRLNFQIDVQHTFQSANPGDCTASLQALSSCYQDVTKCGFGTEEDNKIQQGYANAIVGPFVQAGALSLENIEKAEQLKFTIVYE